MSGNDDALCGSGASSLRTHCLICILYFKGIQQKMIPTSTHSLTLDQSGTKENAAITPFEFSSTQPSTQTTPAPSHSTKGEKETAAELTTSASMSAITTSKTLADDKHALTYTTGYDGAAAAASTSIVYDAVTKAIPSLPSYIETHTTAVMAGPTEQNKIFLDQQGTMVETGPTTSSNKQGFNFDTATLIQSPIQTATSTEYTEPTTEETVKTEEINPLVHMSLKAVVPYDTETDRVNVSQANFTV